MELRGIEHVQIAIPQGGEGEARAFYRDLLGLEEKPKPAVLSREGAWFEKGGLKVHLGVDRNFRPATRAHIAFVVDDVPGLRADALRLGFSVREAEPLEGFDRVFVNDPFGNRLEFMQPLPMSQQTSGELNRA
jgi:catechol 2,3-dioxygenase-like lactoylglutathione lyase family enzyme